jgi:hypothetical protein
MTKQTAAWRRNNEEMDSGQAIVRQNQWEQKRKGRADDLW